ncbi:hypothetical protein [Candidatus Spongiihabitans sp.]|uniref:hypothetical protein n=1 Tax=Candidatus Spongiihabitans sp. TaxID=3101308 RepID=UPI003C6FE172
MSTMKVTAWANGAHDCPATAYGFKVKPCDREKYFDRGWKTVTIVLPTGKEIQVNVDKKSFWNKCPELINKEIRDWLRETKEAPWDPGCPPTFEMTVQANGKFTIST